MPKRNLIKRLLIWTLLLTIAHATTAYGQSSNSHPQTAKPPTPDAEFLKAAEIAIAERDKFKAQSLAKDEIIAAKDLQISALRALLTVQTQISSDWMNAATSRKAALVVDDKILADYNNQIIQLRAERDSARNNSKLWTIGGAAFGILLGVYVRPKN